MILTLRLASSLLSVFLFFQPAARQWKEYISREGKFTVMLPGEPTTVSMRMGEESPSSVTYITDLRTPAAAYILGYFDIPDPVTESGMIDQLLDDTRDRIIKIYSLKPQSETKKTWMEFPGRSMMMKTYDGKPFLLRIYLVKQRVYYLSVTLLLNQEESSEAKGFFESFKPTPLTDEEIKNVASFSQAENNKALVHKIRVSENVADGSATTKVQPVYPAEAKAAGITGLIKVRVLISEDGQVIEAEAVSGPEQLQDAALKAANQWRFKPTLLSNYPVKVEVVLSFNFRLDK
ncbi:MAG: energy transducer TonB [Acidobacteria bacterium]|nr:energy transducer TonB [Acidobacteriota bacterium]